MSVLLEKAEENLQAGRELIDCFHFNSCVHCFYYSVFQSIIAYNNKFDLVSSGINSNHNITINACAEDFDNAEIRLKFHEQVGWLKRLRNKADYQPLLIKSREATKSQEKAEYLVALIKTSMS